jgi:murein L,D-transpeptidase YafK
MNLRFWRLAALGLIGAAGAMLAGCEDSYLPQGSGRSEQPISSATVAEMTKIDTTPSSPVLIRTYKKEAELEVWKMNSQGQYALLKTYPMCRWSGQLGPKKREGDMQVPEGFYPISPGQMNPNSHYYLAFNVGYPNAYDRALGRDGGSVMVHGVCSSAGCFSMTDEQVADIYAIARDAFRGGQHEIQLQSYPFHMTAENMTKYRLDPNIAFWEEIKKGADYFEVTKTEPPVLVCNRHYEFGATAKGSVSATAACPQLERDDAIEQQIAEKESTDEAKEERLAASGVKAIRTVYADGGQNPLFTGYKDTSDPEALQGSPQEIVLNDGEKPVPAAVKVARADARKAAKVTPAPEETAAAEDAAPLETASTAPAPAGAGQPQTVALAAPAAQASEASGGMLNASTSNVKKWLNWGGGDTAQPAAIAQAPAGAALAAPLPPSRSATEKEKAQRVVLRSLPAKSAASEKPEPDAQSAVTQ